MRSSCFLVAMLLAGAVVAAAPGTVLAQSVPAGFTDNPFVSSGISSGTAMAFDQDGRLFVCEQNGRLEVYDASGTFMNVFVQLSVTGTNERGLLGVAFNPSDPANDRYVYIFYSESNGSNNRVSRFKADAVNGNLRDTSFAEDLLITIPMSSGYHNGGAIHFGTDGMLYIAAGDGHSSGNAQNMGNLNGKILRLNPNGSIPTNNPFYNSASGNNRAIWALGLRNPFSFAVQQGSGRIFINDVGSSGSTPPNRPWEEINEGTAGANFGWPTTEGDFNQTTYPNFTRPLYAYPKNSSYGTYPTYGNCIAGGAFYPSSGPFPATYRGNYFFADYANGNFIAVMNSSTYAVVSFATGLSSPVDIDMHNGALYYLARGSGQVRRISYTTTSQDPVVNFTNPSNNDTVSGTVAVNAVAYDGDIGTADGDGIQNVVFELLQGATVVASHQENVVTYDWSLNTANYANGSYTLRATATSTSAAGGTSTSTSIAVTISNAAPNQAPTATINSPSPGAMYNAGDTLSFSGSGTDPEDGTLGAGAFTWRIDFHHDTHTHPGLPDTPGITSGTFPIPTVGETSSNVWFRVYLTVTDSGGLSDTAFVDVLPNTADITVTTSPAGLQVLLDGSPWTAPVNFTGVVGVIRTLGADGPQNSGGVDYSFVSWSDGGNVSHTISTPASNTTYTATFGIDSDADGMADTIELFYGLDPNNQDQDGNSQRDGLDDWDNDGIDNQTEAANGFAPGSPGGGGPGPAGNGSKSGCGALGLDAIVLLLGAAALRRRLRRRADR